MAQMVEAQTADVGSLQRVIPLLIKVLLGSREFAARGKDVFRSPAALQLHFTQCQAAA